MHLDPTALLLFPACLLSVVVHEVAHGLVAGWRGDPTARDAGRVTLNPLPHMDPIGSLLVPAVLALAHAPVVVGWARPAPVDRARLRDLRNDPARVATTFAVLLRSATWAGQFERVRFSVLDTASAQPTFRAFQAAFRAAG